MIIETRPQAAPTLAFAGDNDMNILVKGLGLDFMAELDHRKARVLAMDLEVDAGVDIAFDGATGGLGVEIDLGADAISANVAENDFAPDSSEGIEESFSTVFNGLVGGILGDALGDLSFSIPGFFRNRTDGDEHRSSGRRPGLAGRLHLDWRGQLRINRLYRGRQSRMWRHRGRRVYGRRRCSGCEGGGCTAAPRESAKVAVAAFPALLTVLRRRD